MAIPTQIIIGHTPVQAIDLSLRAVPRGERRFFDVCGFQGMENRTPVGERGICQAPAFTPTGDGRFQLDLDKLRAWAKALPADAGLVGLNYEANNNEFDYLNETTLRALRIAHAAVLKERPDVLLSAFISDGLLVWPADLAKTKRLATSTGDRGGVNSARGWLDANHIVAGRVYPTNDWTRDQIEREVARHVEVARAVAKPTQLVGLWTCILDQSESLSETINRNPPLLPWIVAHVARRARMEGAHALLEWCYQSDPTGTADGANDPARVAARDANYEPFRRNLELAREVFA